MRKSDLAGQIFGRLTAIRELDIRAKSGHVKWECQCECGNITFVVSGDLKNGTTNSCGCYRTEMMKTYGLKHGHGSKGNTSSEYEAWHSLIQRCTNPNSKYYYNYGGRGVKVCERWLGENGFENFYSDMGPKPSPEHSIDRFPNNETGHYEPENCRWGTSEQQARNKRNNVWLSYNGITMIQADWAHKIGITPGMIFQRLKQGWPLERVLSSERFNKNRLPRRKKLKMLSHAL